MTDNPLSNDEVPSGCPWGCLTVIASATIGVTLAWLQNENTLNAWDYCSNLAHQVATDLADQGQVSVFSLLGRVVIYSLCLPLGILIGRLSTRGHSAVIRAIAGLIGGLAICALAFWGDYALNNGMLHGFYLPSRCPGGRPPWWPSWLPLRISRKEVLHG
jgi:hypothetical protein